MKTTRRTRRRSGAGVLVAATLVLSACATPGRMADGGNDFVWPVAGSVISAYGPKPGNRYNDGVNIAAPAGTPIRASADGIVIYAGNELRSFGNLILIRHAAGWTSTYAHTEAVRVKRNQRVAKGATIAAVGQSGAVFCPQLHFELRREAKAVDPLAVLPKLAKTRTAAPGAPGEVGCRVDAGRPEGGPPRAPRPAPQASVARR